MVNEAINEIKKIINNCIVWEIDCDEIWTLKDIEEAEKLLINSKCKMGRFYANQIVGKNLVAEGPNWGGNVFHRLFNWDGEYFKTHEPPELDTQDKSRITLPQKFNHYAYYFSQDVYFKAKWYYNNLDIYEKWKLLQEETNFPQPLEYFLKHEYDYYKGTFIYKKEIKEFKYERKYNILIPYFIHNLDSRNKEFKKCILKNLENKYIKNIYLFFENFYDSILNQRQFEFLKNKRIKIINIYRRQEYKDLIDFSSKYLQNEICILSNTDIWFDYTISSIDKFDLNNSILALTRYDSIKDYKLHNDWGNSHDSWIFKSPLKKFENNIQMGILGCDSYFNLKAKEAGIQLMNPCYEIKSYHEHSDLRHSSITRNNKLKNNTTYGSMHDWRNILVLPQKL